MAEGHITYIRLVGGKTMIDARWQNKQIVPFKLNTYPVILLASDIKVALAAPDIADLLVLVAVLDKERLDLVFVRGPHLGGRDGNFVSVLIASLRRQLIDVVHVGEVKGEHPELIQVVDTYGAARVVREALVALGRVSRGFLVVIRERADESIARTGALSNI